jgi:antitoxin VapB
MQHINGVTAMALYLKDSIVDELTDKLATLRKASKVDVVRQALQDALEKEQAKPSIIDMGVQFCRDLRVRGNSSNGKPADKVFRDGLYE